MGRGENVSTIVSQAVLLVSKPNTQPVWPRISAARIVAKGTESSNPPLSATQSVLFTYNLE